MFTLIEPILLLPLEVGQGIGGRNRDIYNSVNNKNKNKGKNKNLFIEIVYLGDNSLYEKKVINPCVTKSLVGRLDIFVSFP